MKKFVWGAEQERAFNEMKTLIRAADVLCNPDYGREFFLKGDASEKGCGAVLFQLDGQGRRRVIAYASKKFCLRESKWRVMERELFSIIFGLQIFRCFVQGCAIHIINDHKNLVWLKSNDTSSKLTRWSLVLDEIAIKSWSHAPGSEMGVEDGLSRGGGQEPDAALPEMSERERILLEEEDIQLSALRALGTSGAQSLTQPTPNEDTGLDVDLDVEAEVLLSTLVALRQSWMAASASTTSGTTCPPSQRSASDSGANGDFVVAGGFSAPSPPLGVTKRVGAKAARATPEFIASSEARRSSIRPRATDVNARATAALAQPTDDRERRRIARAAIAEAAAAARLALRSAAAQAADSSAPAMPATSAAGTNGTGPAAQSTTTAAARSASGTAAAGETVLSAREAVAAAGKEAAFRRAVASEAAAVAEAAARRVEALKAAAASAHAAAARPASEALGGAAAARRKQAAAAAEQKIAVAMAEATETSRAATAAEAVATLAESAAAAAVSRRPPEIEATAAGAARAPRSEAAHAEAGGAGRTAAAGGSSRDGVDGGSSDGDGARLGSGSSDGGGARPGSGSSDGGEARLGSGSSDGDGARPGSGSSDGGGARLSSGSSDGDGARLGSGSSGGGGARLGSGSSGGGGARPGSGSGAIGVRATAAASAAGRADSATSGTAAPGATGGGESGPSVATAEKQGKRVTAAAYQPILSSKEKEGTLATAAKAMLQQARRLAATARAVAVDNVRWRQARQLEGPVAYDGQIRQREAQRAGALGLVGAQAAPTAPAGGDIGESGSASQRGEPRALLVWSTLSEARKKELFEGAHLFPNDYPGVVQTVKRLLDSGRFSLERGEYGRMFEDVTRWRRACPVCQMLQEARSQDAPVSAIPSRPFFDTSVDFLDIAADVEGHTSVCAIVDNFSGFTQLYPCVASATRLVPFSGTKPPSSDAYLCGSLLDLFRANSTTPSHRSTLGVLRVRIITEVQITNQLPVLCFRASNELEV
jgi:hypothetical protein